MGNQLIRSINSGLCACLLAMLVSSCSPPFLSKLNTAKPRTPPPQEQPIRVAHRRPPLTAAIWIDITSSNYPSDTFGQALQKTADAIEQYVQPWSAGATLHVAWINSNSFRPESVAMVITIPPLPADPPQPVLKPLPQRTNNPYHDAEAQKHIEKENARKLADWQATLKRNHAQLAQVKKQVKQQTDILRKQVPAVDPIATDVYGALHRSSLWFQSAPPGEKVLIIEASDLKNNTHEQDAGSLRLDGVRARILFHTCQRAPECTTNDAYWANVLSQAGVTDLLMLDPAASQARSTVLL